MAQFEGDEVAHYLTQLGFQFFPDPLPQDERGQGGQWEWRVSPEEAPVVVVAPAGWGGWVFRVPAFRRAPTPLPVVTELPQQVLKASMSCVGTRTFADIAPGLQAFFSAANMLTQAQQEWEDLLQVEEALMTTVHRNTLYAEVVQMFREGRDSEDEDVRKALGTLVTYIREGRGPLQCLGGPIQDPVILQVEASLAGVLQTHLLAEADERIRETLWSGEEVAYLTQLGFVPDEQQWVFPNPYGGAGSIFVRRTNGILAVHLTDIWGSSPTPLASVVDLPEQVLQVSKAVIFSSAFEQGFPRWREFLSAANMWDRAKQEYQEAFLQFLDMGRVSGAHSE